MGGDEEVSRANREFYHALSERDLGLMEGIWLHEPWVRCVHPGWPMVTGWEDVRETWRRIFSGPIGHRIDTRKVEIRVIGEVGWVSCLEQISVFSEAPSLSLASCTNLFLSTSNGWKLVLHHASPVSLDAMSPPTERVH